MFYIPTVDILETSFKLEVKQREDYLVMRVMASSGCQLGIEDSQDLCADFEQALDF